jgi:hypothetical protein
MALSDSDPQWLFVFRNTGTEYNSNAPLVDVLSQVNKEVSRPSIQLSSQSPTKRCSDVGRVENIKGAGSRLDHLHEQLLLHKCLHITESQSTMLPRHPRAHITQQRIQDAVVQPRIPVHPITVIHTITPLVIEERLQAAMDAHPRYIM